MSQIVVGADELKTYLGIALEQPELLVQARARVCAKLGLRARAEAHVTIAYLGRLGAEQRQELCAGLLPLLDDSLVSLQLEGAGAAYEPVAGVATLLRADGLHEALAHACVAWWSVTPAPAVLALRNAASQLLAKMGRPVNATEPFCPHVTLGSRGRADIADEDFDLHLIEKPASLAGFPCVGEARAARIHIAASQLLPASVVCLRSF
jgi:2'-5' RNA ligase